MKVEKSTSSYGGPTSSLGIMRFFESGGGPKITPEIAFALCAVFGLAILILQKL
ncbi:MAG: preprotein translocase subunit Sec61beta [Candidatus Diapherotrites archaeon]|nr:preprotein translocase subunit Sec61beta [Candidatus Diapherotrites archaeon]